MPGKSQGDLVRALLAQGQTVEEVVRATGLSRRSIAQYVQWQGSEQRGWAADDVRRTYKSKSQIAREMIRQGAKTAEIVEKTGLSYKTITDCRAEIDRENGVERPQKQVVWPLELQIRWVVAVNTIRLACGLKPLPMPGE